MSLSARRAVIVDDEPLAREGLRILLSREGDVEIVAECENGPQAVEALRSQRPDLLLLDVQMPEMSGFQVLQEIEEPPPAVIFITAYDEFAVRAFEVHALDYSATNASVRLCRGLGNGCGDRTGNLPSSFAPYWTLMAAAPKTPRRPGDWPSRTVRGWCWWKSAKSPGSRPPITTPACTPTPAP